MHVVLPDNSQLELPEGATGLDAARAIGPKLAEQAVLARVNGEPRDLRLAAARGCEPRDPHSARQRRSRRAVRAAPLVRAPARRGRPPALSGREGRDRPADRERLLLRLRFPAADRRSRSRDGSRRRSSARSRRAATWEREEISRAEAQQRFLEENEPYKVELVDIGRGRHLSLHAGELHRPLPRPAPAEREADQGVQAHRPRRRVLARRREEQAAHPHLRHRLLLAGRSRRAPRSGSKRRASATTAGSASQLDLFHFDEYSPGSPFWHPKGMVIWNALEDLRRRENKRRGYVEVKTPLIYDKALWETSGHWEKFRENMFLIPEEEQTFGLKPMNCPGPHAASSATACGATASCRCAWPRRRRLHRNELAGALHGPDPRAPSSSRTTRTSSAPATRSRTRSSAASTSPRSLYDLFGLELQVRALDPTGEQARHRRGVGLHRRRARAQRSSAAGSSTCVNEGDGAFYGPKIDLHMTDSLGRSWQMGTIQLDSQMPQRFGLTYVGADNARAHSVRDPPRGCRLARAVHRHPDRALRRRVPVLARAGADPHRSRRARRTATPRTRSRRSSRRTASRSTRATTPSARGSGTPRCEKIPFVARLRRQGVRRGARDPGARRGPGDPVPWRFPGETCYPHSLASRGGTVSHLLTTGLGGSTDVRG